MDILNKGERMIGDIKPLCVVKMDKKSGEKLLEMYPSELVIASNEVEDTKDIDNANSEIARLTALNEEAKTKLAEFDTLTTKLEKAESVAKALTTKLEKVK